MAYALGSSLLLLLLGLVTRRLLVDNFGTQVTTASQVVSQLFNFFSIAEFGVGSVISYRLYEQIAAKNEEKISKYMSMYKWAYRAVGSVIALLALCGAAALPWIMPDVPLATGYTVYGLNVVSTLCSYFLVTRRLMYTCTQQGYRCTQIDFCCNVLTSLAKIAVSMWWPSYVLYFSVSIFFNVCANLLIAWRFKKDFPYVKDVKVTLADFKDLGIFHDLRYYLVHRLSNTIYGSSDTIVTSRMGGSTQTTFLGNYNTISTSATDTDHLDNGRRFLVQIKIYKSVDHGIIRLFVYSSSLKSVPIFRLSHPFVSGTSLTPRWLRSKRSTRRLDSRFCFLARSSSCF